MANEKLKCENCGFEEELSAAQVEERKKDGIYATCVQCGADMTIVGNAAANEQAGTGNNNAGGPDNQDSKYKQDKQDKQAEKSTAEAAKESAKQAAEAAKAKLMEAFAAGRKDPVFIAGFIDKGIKKLTSLLCPECFDKNAPRAITLGHYAILLLALLSLVMGLIMGIRYGISQIILSGIAGAGLLLFAQYLAVKSFALFDGIIANHQSKLTGPALVEIFAIINMICAVGGIVLIVTGITNNVDFALIATGLLLLILGYLTAVLLMQADKQLNVKYDAKTTLGEQLLGIVTLNIKATVKLMPYIFGLGMAVCTIMCIPPLVALLFKSGSAQSLAELSMLVGYAVLVAFSPILIYIWVMLTCLIVDLAKSILSLGSKK